MPGIIPPAACRTMKMAKTTKSKTMVHGVDISYCQTGLDYGKLRDDGIQFVMIRAGYTGTASHKQHADNMLSKHVKGCTAAGLPYGYYWYSAARTVKEAQKEARFCASLMKKYPKPDYPVFLDLEEQLIADTGKDNATDICFAFINEMNYLGYPSGIYTNPDWLENKLDKSRLVGRLDIWLAHWTNSCGCEYGQVMWQSGLKYSAGKMIDYNTCYIDYPKKTAAWYQKHFKTAGTSGAKPAAKSVAQLAQECIEGKWGNGAVRKSRLTAAGYDYQKVQAKVNSLLAAKKR